MDFGDWTTAYAMEPDPNAIYLAAPSGGDVLNINTTSTIWWNYTGNPGSSVNIELLKNGAYHSPVTASVSMGSEGIGSYNWALPSDLVSGSDYAIQVTSNTNGSF